MNRDREIAEKVVDEWLSRLHGNQGLIALIEAALTAAYAGHQAEVEKARREAWPEKLTPEIAEVLSMMLWDTASIAHAFRAAGYDIPRKTEAEQAFALHWLIGLALKHGAEWKTHAASELEAISARLTVQEAGEG